MYGYSANSICADALDKIFVVAANKYELTPKWFCFGSYLPRDHQLDFSICATMVRGWTCFGQITFLGVRLPICLGRLLTFYGCSFDRDCLLGRFPDLDQGLNLILGFLIGLFPTGSLLLILGSHSKTTINDSHRCFDHSFQRDWCSIYRFLTGFQVSHKVTKYKQRPKFWYFWRQIWLDIVLLLSLPICIFKAGKSVAFSFWTGSVINIILIYSNTSSAPKILLDTMALVGPWSYQAWLWPRSSLVQTLV